MTRLSKIEEKLEELDLQREAYISKIKRIMDNNKQSEQPIPEQYESVVAFFSYSCNLTEQADEDNVIIGSLAIHNFTFDPIEQLSVCLVIETDDNYQFSGKYVTNNKQQNNQNIAANWERITDTDEQNMYWFQWVGKQPIEPFTSVAFSDFTVSWPVERSFFCSIKGFIYSENHTTGLEAMNTVSLQKVEREWE
ncbi:hypothetical protein Pryu01_01461 [Paraliobacillus ryukyuensis]|uniref:Uncharacterized protein n=1 Tax=Paraliobacillus ryukyuensis TaxID=200904 RepID=A0A366EEA6_9BACI|nr:hypothetical protein [Paraliobacillus ryukyuensis]RBO99804.1 hypothetical protein DES48_103131 [Paraliobacillus ryukyuensis]